MLVVFYHQGQFSAVVKHTEDTGGAVEPKCLGSSGLSAPYRLCDFAADKYYLLYGSCEDAMSSCTSSPQKTIWHIKSNHINYCRVSILVYTRTYITLL